MIADPDPAARRAIKDALQSGAGFAVPAAASSGVEALELIAYYRPEIALLDLALSDPPGIEVVRRLTAEVPAVRILVYSHSDDAESQLDALGAGASGFVSKQTGADGLRSAIEGILRGEAAVSRGVSMDLVEQFRARPSGGDGMRPIKSPLTGREWEVLDLMCRGLDTKGIAAELVLSEETVYTHIKHLMRKLDVHSRSEACEVATRLRTLGPGGAA